MILCGSPVIPWISLGGKPKWLPLKIGYHDIMRTSPISRHMYQCIVEMRRSQHPSEFFGEPNVDTSTVKRNVQDREEQFVVAKKESRKFSVTS